MKIDDKDLNKFMKKLGFVATVTTKHCLVFSNGIHRLRTSKTTSDKNRRLKNVKSQMQRLGYAI